MLTRQMLVVSVMGATALLSPASARAAAPGGSPGSPASAAGRNLASASVLVGSSPGSIPGSIPGGSRSGRNVPAPSTQRAIAEPPGSRAGAGAVSGPSTRQVPATPVERGTAAEPVVGRSSTPPANAWTDAAPPSGRARQSPTAVWADESADGYRQYTGSGTHDGLTPPAGMAGTYLNPGAYGAALTAYANKQIPPRVPGIWGSASAWASPRPWDARNRGYDRYWLNGDSPSFYAGEDPLVAPCLGYPFSSDLDNTVGSDANRTSDGDLSAVVVDPGVPSGNQPAASATAAHSSLTNDPSKANGPETKSDSEVVGIGPDSLIEAVQAELARRGFFSGPVNAMYGPTTREALRRFQSEVGLAATGRVNGATMHALQLD